MPRSRPQGRPVGGLRGSPQLRLRIGFVVIAMVLSVFAGRLVQLQGVDPRAYAEMAAAEGTVEVVLPAARGDIVDRNGEPLAESVEGLMVVADPFMTVDRAPEIARFLARRLGVDYVETLTKLREDGSRFEYIARRVPATLATDVLAAAAERGFEGLDTRRDPVRAYPAGEVAANLVGFLGTDEALGGFERTFDDLLAGSDGSARYEVGGGNRIPLGDNTVQDPVDGADLHTTIDRDLQFFTQTVLRQTVVSSGGESGVAVVMDRRTGELLALADYPTFDANTPLEAPDEDLGSRAMQAPYEPGSVQKVLTMAALIDAGLVTPRTRLTVPGTLFRQDRPIGDWFDHGRIRLTLAGVLAKSSNIGTVLAADRFRSGELRRYLRAFGLGERTGVGVRGESQGILPAGSMWTEQTEDRIAFGQALAVNALQMTAAVNTIANGGVRITPSLVQGAATTDDGAEVGTETAVTSRVISERAAHQTMLMMERVVDPEAGVAPAAQVPGYRVAGKTGTAQRAGDGGYDGTFTVSFAGFAPADDPRFTVYVVVQAPTNGGGGGSVAGPAFAKIMSYALRRYGVPPTDTRPSRLPVEW
ncbi:peptidoglycan D,D-transpeptidase FtsI family protein [Nocardioides ferulae]|uniref:peptidoglycan D,D-transpeptidase FtsI family protein n=1 Tax=Nocardioides ferulae TaxID=2340821 RepID=UPI001F0B8DA8|nr:penicillin-binding protein 2 [Nocardioides ferulae]